MKTILLFLLCTAIYGNTFYSHDELQTISGDSADHSLMEKLQSISSKNHIMNEYREARWFLYTDVYLDMDEKDRYYVEDIYCEKKFYKNAGPDSMPRGSKTNIEHSWPQSKFSNEYSRALQKGDLHHLFITNAKANHSRGHYRFGEVESYFNTNGNCRNAGLGLLVNTPADVAGSSSEHYEPPMQHRGNIARALFYFSSRYRKKINDTEEYFLKKWHKEDPVNDVDRDRNDRIMRIQGNRNPFIDYPELVDRIKNF